jgi:hypothetical protein
MKQPNPKTAIRCAYLSGRRGVSWPLAWARVRLTWEGAAAYKSTQEAWNTGREAAGLYRVRIVD